MRASYDGAIFSTASDSMPAPQTPKRGPAGTVGKGTPGRRLRRHARENRIGPVRTWARGVAKDGQIDSALKLDCIAWLASKVAAKSEVA